MKRKGAHTLGLWRK